MRILFYKLETQQQTTQSEFIGDKYNEKTNIIRF